MKKEEEKRKFDNTFGLASTILGILSIVFASINGIVFGIIGLVFAHLQNKRFQNSWSRAGKILSIIGIILSIILITLIIIGFIKYPELFRTLS